MVLIRLIILIILNIIGLFFGYKLGMVRFIERHWKGLFVLFALMLLIGCGSVVYISIRAVQGKVAEKDAVKEIEQTVSDKYGIDVELGGKIDYSDIPKKYVAQKEYLSTLCHGRTTVGIDWYVAYRKDTSPETEFLCVRNKEGQIMASYPYDKMIELTDACGLESYRISDTNANTEDIHMAYLRGDYLESFAPVFDFPLVKEQFEDFYSKWDTFVQTLREEESIWWGKECVYVQFYAGGSMQPRLKFQIFRKENKKSEQRQMKELKKWINN